MSTTTNKQFHSQIVVLKKKDKDRKDVLIEMLDMIYTTDDKGNFNYKILMNVQQSANGKTDTTSFYWSMDELKQIAYEIQTGLMKGLRYPTGTDNRGKDGIFEVIRGNKYGRQLKIGSNENYVVVELSHYNTDPSKSKNGEVVIVGSPTKACKIVLTDYEARGFFGKVVDFINRTQMKEMFNTPTAQVVTPSAKIEVKEEPKVVKEVVVDQDGPATTTQDNIPIVPGSGKMAGKPASEIPSGQRKWFIDTFGSKPAWKETVEYLRKVEAK